MLAAVLCLSGFGLWYHWYHYSESYISLKESGLQADGEKLGADQMEVLDTVKSVYYLSEQGWKLYCGDVLSLDKDSQKARQVSEKIEAASTKLAER